MSKTGKVWACSEAIHTLKTNGQEKSLGQSAILEVSNFVASLEKHVSCWAELNSNSHGNGF